MFQAKQVADKKNTEKNEKRMKEIERKKQVYSLIETKWAVPRLSICVLVYHTPLINANRGYHAF